jgi:hypothetical protein
MATAFQRNAFQNNAFQIRTRHIGGAIVPHTFSRQRYRKLEEELAAAIAADREAEEAAAATLKAAKEAKDRKSRDLGEGLTRERYRTIVDGLEAEAVANRQVAEREAEQAAEAARAAEEMAKSERLAVRNAEDRAAAQRQGELVAAGRLQGAADVRSLVQALQSAHLRAIAVRSENGRREGDRAAEAAAIARLLESEEENMRQLRQRSQAIIRRLLTLDRSRGQPS